MTLMSKETLTHDVKTCTYVAIGAAGLVLAVIAGHYALDYFLDWCGDAYSALSHWIHPGL